MLIARCDQKLLPLLLLGLLEECNHLFRLILSHLEERWRDAMHKHRVLSRQMLDCIRELDDLVAMYPTHPLIDVLEHQLLELPPLLPPSVIEVVCVHDPNHMCELVGPPPAMMVPVEVLGLLQHCHVSFVVWDDVGDVAHWEDAPCCKERERGRERERERGGGGEG